MIYYIHMTNTETNRPLREDMAGWKLIASADNDVEILECKIRVDNFSEGADVANKIAPLVMQYEPLDSDYTIHVNVAQQMVDITMTVPKGFWASEDQKKLAHGVAVLAN